MRKTIRFLIPASVTYDDSLSTAEAAVEDFFRALEAYAAWTGVRDEAAGLADRLRAAQDKLAGFLDRQVIDISYGRPAIVRWTTEPEDNENESPLSSSSVLWQPEHPDPAGPAPRPEDMEPVPGEQNKAPGEDIDYDTGATSLLPSNEVMNPARPESAVYYDPDQVAYVVREVTSGQIRVLTSFGHLGPAWEVGTEHALRHDQTWHPLGTWAVIGFRNYRDGLIQGEIPDRPLRHWVFK